MASVWVIEMLIGSKWVPQVGYSSRSRLEVELKMVELVDQQIATEASMRLCEYTRKDSHPGSGGASE